MSKIMDGAKRKNASLGELSFSSYLSAAEGIFVHKLAEPANQHPHPAIAPSGGVHAPARLESNKTQASEIGVFGAENYFNMKLDADIPRPEDKYSNKRSLKMENQIDMHQMTPRCWPGTPSVSSEASWNSQTVLLRSFMRSRSENKQKKLDGGSFFSTLSCSGSCSDGKSVYVCQNVDHGKEYRKGHTQPINIDRRKLPQAKFQLKDEFDRQTFDQMSVGSNREVNFVPQVLKPGLQNVRSNTQLDDPRKSLEVFGSTAMKKGDISKNIERKLSMLTWDAVPKTASLSSISRSSQVGDDIESDASSDLFEIDNISGSGHALFARQTSDGMSSSMAPYAPSESRIEWRVVTASAADCSFVSDHDEKKSAENISTPGSKTAIGVANAKILPNKEAQRSRSSGVLGCKSHKAVMVAETSYTRDEKSKPSHIHQLLKSVIPMTARLLQADNKVKDLDFH